MMFALRKERTSFKSIAKESPDAKYTNDMPEKQLRHISFQLV